MQFLGGVTMIGEMVVHGAVFIVMAFLFYTSFSFPALNIGGNLGAGWWPRLVVGLGMFFTALSTFFAVRKYQKAGDAKKTKINKKELASLGCSAGIIVLALLLIQIIGFLGAAPIILFGFMFQLGGRKIRSLILFPILATLVFTFMFGRFMEVSLPRGLGIMRVLSFYIF
jgi:hypothetical protein